MFDLRPDDWRTENQRTRLRLGRILGVVSRRYFGEIVPLDPSAHGLVAVHHVLIRVEAIPRESPEVNQWPAFNRAPRVPIDQLRPGLNIRVGQRRPGSNRRSYRFRITSVGETLPDGRIELIGDRITDAGRPLEHLTIRIPPDALYPSPTV